MVSHLSKTLDQKLLNTTHVTKKKNMLVDKKNESKKKKKN